jgi:ATP-dependent DNA helicase
VGDTDTVEQVAFARWRVRPAPAIGRFTEPGWSYAEPVARPCPRCHGKLHSLRKPYVSAGRSYRYVALVCPACPASFTLADLGAKTYDEVTKAARRSAAAARSSAPPAGRPPAGPTKPRLADQLREVGRRLGAEITGAEIAGAEIAGAGPARDRPVADGRGVMVGSARDVAAAFLDGCHDCDVRPGTLTVRTVREVRAGPSPGGHAPRSPGGHAPRPSTVRAGQPLWWVKTTDPTRLEPMPDGVPDGVQVRVLLPDDDRFAAARTRLQAAGAQVRAVRYWVEDETISTAAGLELVSRPHLCALTNQFGSEVPTCGGPSAAAARDAFDMVWQAHEPQPDEPVVQVPAADLVPAEWVRLLSHPTFNPAQAQAVPHLLGTDAHVMVVAPTGAGKTAIGMVAALQTVLGQRRRAAWLVPQRSLTDELDHELQRWRAAGLRVQRLSGEYAVDVEKVRDADVWVTTTEKFEAICRASSLQRALADVGCLVVDEVHLLGDAARGPVLEALLARVRGAASKVRIIGLSATVSNAEQIADWLGAKLIRVAWRPTRLTWQLPMIAATSDRAAANTARARLATALARPVTDDDGSVLVFCGSRHNVRTTALAVAADRGATVTGVDPADLDRVHAVCTKVGVGLHYKDWPYRRDAERGFRDRSLQVLVATTTVAAGVNLPARAVIVRDTQVGLDALSVSTVQQMFGRAGRVGAGEREGFAYLICDENERPAWQQRLVDGYTATSQILDTVPDHVLAEAVQGRVATRREAEAWWEQTLAFHQGDRDLHAIGDAVDFLAAAGYLTVAEQPSGDADLTPTELGVLTTRLMVSSEVGLVIRSALADAAVPADPQTAEDILLDLLATAVPELADAPVADDLRPAVARLLQAGGRLDRLGATRTFTRGGLGIQTPLTPGDLAKAALKLAAHNPTAFRTPARAIAGIPTAIMYPIWENAPRSYLHWLAGQGHLTTVHPWVAIVAGDLGRRIRWRHLGPRRGAGRLLWMCEQMATPLHATDRVPDLFKAATRRGITGPDWTASARPTGCQLDVGAYTTLLRDRATGTHLAPGAGEVTVAAPPGMTIITWAGTTLAQHRSSGDRQTIAYPPRHDEPAPTGAAVFSRRGDFTATGWLTAYHHIDAELES